ncbi:nitrogenase cofactor biosynthesis protein NifB [Methanonatronarchaeum sp. AMET6-2]|uniref:nitrogenase cofactor biosynthesis protein NifB n=1 Tax=Methanonatronarchaeum sp. AMET6-2 TaxID=2933293 RepID=UPI001FF2F79D|nr:nitrogenase cofactor biosynthesis protein NifB [Methanonatronarchaeum sp. AMET6-2]UOY10155.1 nitrogenase cofactor biosynthesis protein NifB [Methanonatronarchaeum sp. AMET6-2]
MNKDNYQTVNVDGREIPFDPEQLRKIQSHPCFSDEACSRFGRLHLPVAPECNIQCNYCIRKYDCVNETRPGVSSDVLTPQQALERASEVFKKYPYIKVVGVAGPGEPLHNQETFKTLELIKKDYPNKILCISTNGLLLPDKIDRLVELGVSNLTITINAVDPEIGREIYSYVKYKGEVYRGIEAAELIIEKQLEGLERAKDTDMILKVNSVLIPTVNEDHIVDIARKIHEKGVYLHNITPLIPQYKFSDIEPPSKKQKQKIQEECSEYVRQMKHCRQCRSDAIGKLGEDKPCPKEKE